MTPRGQVSHGLIALYVEIRHQVGEAITPKYFPAGNDVSILTRGTPGPGSGYHAVCEAKAADGRFEYDIWFKRQGCEPAPHEFHLNLEDAARFLLEKWMPGKPTVIAGDLSTDEKTHRVFDAVSLILTERSAQ